MLKDWLTMPFEAEMDGECDGCHYYRVPVTVVPEDLEPGSWQLCIRCFLEERRRHHITSDDVRRAIGFY